MGSTHPGQILALQCFGRMGQANDILLKSMELRGTPLIDAPTSWTYFNWKLEYDAEHISDDDSTLLHMLRGLQNATHGEMRWIGKIPPEALIEMRKVGAEKEIREVLGRGVADIAAANPADFLRTGEKVIENIRSAFDQHQDNLKKLRGKKWKFLGKDVGSWIVSGSIELAAAVAGLPLFGAAAFVTNQIVDAPKLKDLPENYKHIKQEGEGLKKSAMGLLFRHAKS